MVIGSPKDFYYKETFFPPFYSSTTPGPKNIFHKRCLFYEHSVFSSLYKALFQHSAKRRKKAWFLNALDCVLSQAT
jgi:hypothetical protein